MLKIIFILHILASRCLIGKIKNVLLYTEYTKLLIYIKIFKKISQKVFNLIFL